MAKVSAGTPIRKRLRYYFDSSITRGPSAFVLWLAILGLVATTLITLLDFALNGAPKGTTLRSAISIIGKNANNVLFAGAMPSGTWFARLVALLLWAATIAISATIIAFITNRLKDSIEHLRSGNSPIVESGHTIILGWSNRIFPLIEQLAIANENTRRPLIVVVANGDQTKLQNEINQRVAHLGKTRVRVKAGDPTNPLALKSANILGASAIIALDSDNTSDSEIVSTVLAVKSVNADISTHIVAEVNDEAFGEVLHRATDGAVIPVQPNEIIARVTAQATRQPGLAAVVLDLLDFEGDEIYFQELPQLVGRTYGEALLACRAASVIGIFTAKDETFIHPAMNRKIAAGDKVIAIAKDDDQIKFTGINSELAAIKKVVNTGAKRELPESLLIIGWSEMGDRVLNELAPFLPKGSKVSVLANTELVEKTKLPKKSYGGITVTFQDNRGTISEIARVAKGKKYDEIIVLAYRQKISVADADARTMLTMLLLNKLFDEDGNGIERTRLVAEILDSRRAELARVANPDDLVVSDNLAALLSAQLTQNPELQSVLKDLFDADGATLNVRSFSRYAKAGSNVRYLDLVAQGRSFNETVIGIRSVADGVLLNPSKDLNYQVAEGDGVIVISEL